MVQNPVHNIKFRTFCYSTENQDKVKQAVYNILGNVKVQVKSIEGYHGNEILVLEGKITEKQRVNEVLERLSPVIERTMKYLERHMDDEGVLHVRLDKQKAFDNEFKPTTDGDAVVLTMKILAYPKSRENCIHALIEYFE